MPLASRPASHFPYSTPVFPRSFRMVSGGRLTAFTSGYEQHHLGPIWPGSELTRPRQRVAFQQIVKYLLISEDQSVCVMPIDEIQILT